MFALEIDGLDQAATRLAGCPAALVSALNAKGAELSDALVDRIKNSKLSGEVLNARSGELRDSIAASVSADADGLVAWVGVQGELKYAAIQEYGGKTSAHEILPVKTQALAFATGDAERFARKVEHPGSQIPERSYLRSALDELQGEIISALSEAAANAFERA